MIPMMRPKSTDFSASLRRLEAIQRRHVYSNFGPEVREFEERIAGILNTTPARVVATSNATLALAGALNQVEERSVTLPSFTFAATAQAVLQVNKQGILGDIDQSTWQLLPDSNGSHRSDSASILVLPFGSGLASFDKLTTKRLVIDAAASLSSPLPNLDLLPSQSSIVFSLHATKVLGVGEGGVVVFGSEDAAEEMRRWINFGFDESREPLGTGTNAKMPEIVAAFLNTELENIESTLEEWHVARAIVEKTCADEGVQTFAPIRGLASPYWIVNFSESIQRERVRKSLTVNRIPHRLWWGIGIHRTLLRTKFQFGALTNTDSVSSRYLGLPFFRGITKNDVQRITSVIAQSEV